MRSPTVYLFVTLLLSACSLEHEKKVTLRFQIAGRALPTAHCLAVNVLGRNIPINETPRSQSLPELLAGASCAPIGILSPMVPIGGVQDIEISVPAGPERLIQVLAIETGDTTCRANLHEHMQTRAGTPNPIVPKIHEVGRATVDITRTMTVEIANSYDAAKPREVRCNCTQEMREITDGFPLGDGSASNPYQICTATQWNLINADPTLFAQNFVLRDDLSFTSVSLDPITLDIFTGTFNGGGYTMSGFAVSAAASDLGVFGVNQGTLTKLILTGTVANASSAGDVSTGILVGTNSGLIEECLTAGTVSSGTSGATATGGLVGTNNGTITGSSSSASVSSLDGATGGFVGHHETGTISSSSASGAVDAVATSGGFVGLSEALISDCTSSTIVEVNSSESGGFAGRIMTTSQITRCGATGSITGGSSNIGGFAGSHYGQITESFAKGAVEGTISVGGFVGGLFGSTAVIRDSYATGAVTGSDSVGGFAGSKPPTTILERVYANASSITAPSATNRGNLVGANTTAPINSYSNRVTTAVGAGSNGETTALGTLTNFGFDLAGFNSSNGWNLPTVGIPTLAWEE